MNWYGGPEVPQITCCKKVLKITTIIFFMHGGHYSVRKDLIANT